MFVEHPAVKREETEVGVEERGDEPRVRGDGTRHGEERAVPARPARDGEHGGEDREEDEAQREDHGVATGEGGEERDGSGEAVRASEACGR